MNKKKFSGIWQFIKFGLVGLSNTVVSYGTYVVCVTLGAHYLLASVAGFILSVLNAYFWSNKFVFKQEEGAEKRVWWKVLIKTYIAYGFSGLILNNVLLILWIDVIHIGNHVGPLLELLAKLGIQMTGAGFSEYVAPVLNMLLTVPLNYVINKFWAYRQKSETSKRGKRSENS